MSLSSRYLPAVAVLCLMAAGCSDIEDAAKDTANSAACKVAQSAVDEAKQQAGNAAEQIGADPRSAETELRAVRDALKTAESGISGDVKAQVVEAREALDKLVSEAQDAAEGTPVDQQAVDDAQDDLSSAVDGIRDVC